MFDERISAPGEEEAAKELFACWDTQDAWEVVAEETRECFRQMARKAHLLFWTPAQRQEIQWIADTTFLLELLASADPTGTDSKGTTVVETLLMFSKHPVAVIREGAVYGMEGHLSENSIVERLGEMVQDPSSGVGEAAREAIMPIRLTTTTKSRGEDDDHSNMQMVQTGDEARPRMHGFSVSRHTQNPIN